ncbi:ABC transporter ATP-binding protein [Parvularcula oceani]|uniref:ABC transporter ATP-binding protein n=1 Tax=Parvularcula oceani TaxID=1247963 RepID=UPI0004E2042D|nr:ABC transporter ATP-binding protein [Parvularcula oceani]
MLFRLFESAVPPLPDEAPTPPPGRLLPFVWHYVRPFRFLLLASILTAASIAFLEVFAFELVGRIVDWMGATGPEGFWNAYGGRILAIGLMIALLWPLLTLLDEMIMLQGMMGNMAMSIRWRGHRYLLRQSASFFADDFAGRLATKLMQTALGVRDTVVKLANIIVYMTVYFGSALVLFTANDWRLTVPLILWLLGYGVIMRFFLPRLQRVSEAQSEARSQLTGRIVDAYTNISTVKLFSSSAEEDAYAAESMRSMLGTVYPQMRLATLLSVSLQAINGAMIAATLGLGIWLWSGGALSLGAVAFATTLALRIQGLSHYFLWEVSNLFENLGMTQNGMETLAQPVAVADRSARRLEVPDGAVSFEDVRFTYGRNTAVIDGLTLKIAPGEKVGLVGRSGAGKSTLVSLLLRLYDTESGRVLIDGHDIAGISQESLRRQIAVVSQDTSLLHRTIRENIAYGRPDASEAEIVDAARRAEAWDFIEALEDEKGRSGLDAMVGERGVKLSGGQRQRIALARVILKDAPILVLDEATSALDSEVEAAIQDRMEDLTRGRTVLAIAHRLSTVAAMDRLVVMDAGRIVEQGTHEELLAAGGVYAGLWARQSGGFLAADEVAAQ